jgi:hypothetical protein
MSKKKSAKKDDDAVAGRSSSPANREDYLNAAKDLLGNNLIMYKIITYCLQILNTLY